MKTRLKRRGGEFNELDELAANLEEDRRDSTSRNQNQLKNKKKILSAEM